MKFVIKGLVAVSLIVSGAGCSPPEPTETEGSLASVNEPVTVAESPPMQAPEAEVVAPAPDSAADEVVAAGPAATPAAPAEPSEPMQPAAPANVGNGDPEPVVASGPTIYSGVYTAAQAARGEQAQEKDCSACHAPADWGQGHLLSGFTGQSVFDFVEHIRVSMPMDGPGRLSYQEYVDIVAFILHINEVPTGSRELPVDRTELAKVRMEYRR